MDQNLNTDAETLTKTLCSHFAAAQFGDLSAAAKNEARRGVLDWIGCALAGSGHQTITTLLAVLQEISGKPQATVFGRGLRLGRRRRPVRVAWLWMAADVEQDRAVADRTRDHVAAGEATPALVLRRVGNAAPRRLQPEQAAKRSRHADRAVRIRAHGKWHLA